MEPNLDATLDSIVQLARQIAQSSPDCAGDAGRIVELAGTLRGGQVDKGALRDALATTTVGSDMSDADVSATVERTMRMSRDDPDD